MWQSQFAVYLGQENQEGFFGFIVENNFFLVLNAEVGLDKETGRQALLSIKQELLTQKIESLINLENFIAGQLKKQNLPADVSVATGLVTGKIIYLKTVNKGSIFIRRKNNFEKIISGNKTASGNLEEKDFFVFTTNRFIELFSQESELKTVFDHKTPHQLVEDLAPKIKSTDDQGAIALFIQFSNQEVISTEEDKEETIVSRPMLLEKGISFIRNLSGRWTQNRLLTDRKKTTTLFIVVILALVLFWSVGLGFNRRKESELNRKITRSRELISQKLDQAEETAFLNLSRSQVLISEAKDELNNLRKAVGDPPSLKLRWASKKKEIAEIEKMIKEKESKILKKEEKQAEEVYDLTVDNKNAQGLKTYLDENKMVILDKNQGIIYNLSLSKKSLDKLNNSLITSASLVAKYQDDTFFYVKGKGIYKVNQEIKPKLIIENDSDWGKLTDIWIYNSNIYLLDTGKDGVYKYVAGEDKYGNKSSYFKSGEAVKLSEARSIAIDSSLYIGFDDYIVKYTAGVRDEFKTAFPEENIKIAKIFTNKNLEKVYAWDKNKGSIYILAKNGSYERQVNSPVFSKGNDLVIFENSAYVLVKEKIYKVNLD